MDACCAYKWTYKMSHFLDLWMATMENTLWLQAGEAICSDVHLDLYVWQNSKNCTILFGVGDVNKELDFFPNWEISNEPGLCPSNNLLPIIEQVLMAWRHKHGAQKPSVCPQVRGTEIISINWNRRRNQHSSDRRLLIASGSKYHKMCFQIEAFPN